MTDDRLMTLQEAANSISTSASGITRSTLDRACREGKLVYYRPGKAKLVRLDDVWKWIDGCQKEQREPASGSSLPREVGKQFGASKTKAGESARAAALTILTAPSEH